MPGPLSDAHAVTKLPAQDLDRARRFYAAKLGLEAVVRQLRKRGVTFEQIEHSMLTVDDGIVTATDNYPSKGTGERGAFFRDSEGNLGIGQATGPRV